MELSTIDIIKQKLDVIPQNHYKDILQYLDFLTYQDNKGFQLTQRHLEILEERSKTPIEEYVPAREVLNDLKKKYLV